MKKQDIYLKKYKINENNKYKNNNEIKNYK